LPQCKRSRFRWVGRRRSGGIGGDILRLREAERLPPRSGGDDIEGIAMDEVLRKVLKLLEKRTGLVYANSQAKWVRKYLESRMERLGMTDPGEYYALLSTDEQEWQHFLSAVTVKEGYFFRNKGQFEWIKEEILPDLAERAARERRTLLLWSAATARGEEAYTLAILAIVSGAAGKTEVRVIGSDIDRSAIEEARRGVYTLYRLRGMPPEYVQRFFTQLDDNRYRVNEEVRKMVEFTEINLAKPPYFDPPVKFDLILVRNVFIYMARETIERAVKELQSRQESLSEEEALKAALLPLG